MEKSKNREDIKINENEKVFVILVDIDEEEKLETLLNSNCFDFYFVCNPKHDWTLKETVEDIRFQNTCKNSICDELIKDMETYKCSFCHSNFCKDHVQTFEGIYICDDCIDKGCQLCGIKDEDLVCPYYSIRFTQCAEKSCGAMVCYHCFEVCGVCGHNLCHHHIRYCEKCELWVCTECSCNCED